MTEETLKPEAAKPLLTIAIPTYNRARYLEELLSVLFDQLASEPRVELIVSDNASPDETPAIVDKFQQRGLRIRSIRNETNIGADANFLQCFEQARGKYVWIFGDDDIIIPGGVTAILSRIAIKDYDLVYVANYRLIESSKPHAVHGTIRADEIRDPRIFASRIHIFFTFISGNIINKDLLRSQGPRSFSSLVGTNLVQLGWTYSALNGFVCGLHIREELVGTHIDNSGGHKLLEVFGPTLKRVSRERLQSKAISQVVINAAVQRFWPVMLLKYRTSKEIFAKEAPPSQVLTPAFRDNIRFWCFVYPIFLLPPALAVCWVFVCRIINRVDRAIGFPLLRAGT